MKILKTVGILLMAIGAVDLIGSYTDFDLWGGFVGVDLPEMLWKYSSYIELVIGYLLFNAGGSEASEETAEETESPAE